MQTLTAAKLSSLVNGFSIKRHPSEVIVPHAKQLASLQSQELTNPNAGHLTRK